MAGHRSIMSAKPRGLMSAVELRGPCRFSALQGEENFGLNDRKDLVKAYRNGRCGYSLLILCPGSLVKETFGKREPTAEDAIELKFGSTKAHKRTKCFNNLLYTNKSSENQANVHNNEFRRVDQSTTTKKRSKAQTPRHLMVAVCCYL
jgi:hypothetical protein